MASLNRLPCWPKHARYSECRCSRFLAITTGTPTGATTWCRPCARGESVCSAATSGCSSSTFRPACTRRSTDRPLRVHRLEQVGIVIVDHVALDLERRRELAALDRQVVVEDRELLNLFDLRVV